MQDRYTTEISQIGRLVEIKAKLTRGLFFILLGISMGNKAFGQKFWTINSENDTIKIGKHYKATITVDSNEIRKLNGFEVLFFNNALKNENNDYKIDIVPASAGRKEITLNFIIKSSVKTDTITEKIYYQVQMLSKQDIDSMINDQKNPDYIFSFVEVKPKYSLKNYVSFEDYVIQKLKTENVSCSGKVIIMYVVNKNGKVYLEDITKGAVSKSDSLVFKRIINSSNGSWAPGKSKGKEVNVRMTLILEL